MDPQFEAILAVGLPERTDRRDTLTLVADISDIAFDFVDGMHGSDILNKSLPLGGPGDVTRSEIGSWRGHMNALSRWAASSYVHTPLAINTHAYCVDPGSRDPTIAPRSSSRTTWTGIRA